jgi:thiol-disulfide isomerase/thioredoxin
MARRSTLKHIRNMAAKAGRARRTMRKRGSYLRHRNTTAGRVLPPVDIRSPSGIGELLKRIRKGPVTIVLVYADWCGHCKDFKPIFEKAEKSPNRTAQTVKVNDVMFPQVTDAIKNKLNNNATPMTAEGYPSVILVDKEGNMIKNVTPVKDESTMTSLMEKAGTIANEMNNMSKAGPVKPLPSLNVSKNSIAPSSGVATVSANVSRSMGSLRNSAKVAKSLANEESLTAVPEEVSSSIEPPAMEDDIIANNSANSSRGGLKQGGGGLLAALGHSAYHLAPAGILLGLAASVAKSRRKTRRGGRK